MAGFEYRGQLNGADNPVTIDVTIKNSATVKVGDAVYNDTAGALRSTSSTAILGIVVGIVNANGIDLDNAPTETFDGTWTSSTQTYVAASDNVTDKKIKVKIIADPMALFYNDAAGDMEFVDVGCLSLLTDHDQALGTAVAVVGQVQIVKVDPNGTGNMSEGIFRIAWSQMFGYEVET